MKSYVCQDSLLKQALKHDLVLEKVHAFIKFKHKRWLEVNIILNIYFRTIAENDFKIDANRLLPNSVFGKSVQSERN